MDAVDSDNGSNVEPMSKEMLEDISEGDHSCPIINMIEAS